MNADILAHARGYLGTPWVHQGRSSAGLDCLGLALQYADAKINDSCQGLSIGFDLRIFLHQLVQHCLDLTVDQNGTASGFFSCFSVLIFCLCDSDRIFHIFLFLSKI